MIITNYNPIVIITVIESINVYYIKYLFHIVSKLKINYFVIIVNLLSIEREYWRFISITELILYYVGVILTIRKNS